MTQPMNSNAGDIVDCIRNAVLAHGATPMTEVRVRIGVLGNEHRVHQVKAAQDQRGLMLILECEVRPVL